MFLNVEVKFKKVVEQAQDARGNLYEFWLHISNSQLAPLFSIIFESISFDRVNLCDEV